MRLKIVHQNQQNRVGDDREMKKEEEMEHTHVGIRPEEESTKENSSPLNPSPISVTDPVLASGKRKRKPKEINDEMSPILRRRKKPSTSKSKDKKKQKAGKSGQPEEQSGIDSDEVASEVFGGSKCSGSSIHFKDVKSFEEFHIVVNGVCIDSELPEPVRRKYYKLCCSKNAFLHEGLLPGLYCKLVAGMIFEVVNTADAIKACKLTTPRSDFEVWEKSLRSFELLGLNVGFLWTRLGKLLKLAFNSEGAVDAKKYWKAKTERARTEDEIRDLEAKLDELKEVSVKFDAEIESLKSKAERYELVFQEEVNAPW
ncbi:B3 domain-containing Os01g0234100-like [Olea europaea subsp. europaea]|uniref:B3 domain-containing Os01g0234100-like n=1 Tax=Olea europaea subsp. europaea TaxID=158383 RepID=A0A8S0U7F8_OLEEU|nr:B3 domain-containing Os01g0234100-like [Olea europaea subsp. europaea]